MSRESSDTTLAEREAAVTQAIGPRLTSCQPTGGQTLTVWTRPLLAGCRTGVDGPSSWSPRWLPSERADGEGEVAPWWRDDVALLPGQPQQQVLVVQAPAVDPGALQPGGNVMLLTQTHTGGVFLPIRRRADWLPLRPGCLLIRVQRSSSLLFGSFSPLWRWETALAPP